MNNISKFADEQWIVDTVRKISLSKNIEEIMEVVRTVARKISGADGATFVLKEDDKCYYADEDAISPLWKGSRFPMNICISGWVMIHKTYAAIEDIYDDDRIPADAYKPTFVKSLLMVPIRTNNPIGAIGNYWANTHKPSEEEIYKLSVLADLTAVSIENIEMKNSLQNKIFERTILIEQLGKQKNQLKEFTQIVSHNLRAPLSNLKLISDTVLNTSKIETKEKFIARQQEVVNSLLNTFDDLVNMLNVKNDFTIQREYIDLNTCLNKITNIFKEELDYKNATLSYDFNEINSVYYSKSYLESIFQNLISNSLKYSKPDVSPKISIKAYNDSRWTCLEVEDNGMGIDLDKHKDNIFKLHKTFHDHPDAHGVGLFLTKTQIEAMGGNIYIESQPMEGTKFIINLTRES